MACIPKQCLTCTEAATWLTDTLFLFLLASTFTSHLFVFHLFRQLATWEILLRLCWIGQGDVNSLTDTKVTNGALCHKCAQVSSITSALRTSSRPFMSGYTCLGFLESIIFSETGITQQQMEKLFSRSFVTLSPAHVQKCDCMLQQNPWRPLICSYLSAGKLQTSVCLCKSNVGIHFHSRQMHTRLEISSDYWMSFSATWWG